VEYVDYSGEEYLYSTEEIEKNREIRTEEEQLNKARCDDLLEILKSFNTRLRDESRQQIQTLITTANENARQLANVWGQREVYRNSINKKNDALKYLLQRSAEAVNTVAEEEADRLAEASGQKRTGKGKDKGKKK
jgi:K+/H+ antiporter YhaU regulatory subunit KhtT